MKISESLSGWNFDDLLRKVKKIIMDFGKEYPTLSEFGRDSRVDSIISMILTRLPNGLYSKSSEGDWTHTKVQVIPQSIDLDLSKISIPNLTALKTKIFNELHNRGKII